MYVQQGSQKGSKSLLAEVSIKWALPSVDDILKMILHPTFATVVIKTSNK